MIDNSVSVTGERMTLGGSSSRNQADHLARYNFAKDFAKGKKVLDVACGTGFGVKMLKEAGAEKVVGIDIDKKSIDYAKEKFGSDGISFIAASADNIEFGDNYFDLIVSFETIEHLEDDVRSRYLDELFRVLKPEGILLLSTPNKRITSPWKDKPNNPFHVLEYTRSMLTEELLSHNLTVKDYYGQRFVNKWLTYFFVRKFVRLLEKVLKKNFHIYDFADSSSVRKLKTNIEPRYFVFIVKKSI